MRITRGRFWLAAMAAFAMVGVMLSGIQTAPAQAANPSAGFNAGNIIDDSLFYNGYAMSIAEVQTFLDQQVPECWLGRPGYEVGKPVHWGVPTRLASKCLRDYSTASVSRPANAYCAAYAGYANENAAQIIAKVGQACGISQRVLLITLQKEQSLITDPWPNEQQYFLAMGYACPDSGPGGTAQCDPSQGGFFQQVYRAAWQLKVYRANPNSFNYKPFQSNYIQYNPNQACGGTNVYIQNWATAALYIYTPYQPNQAALNAGWGTGDSCSAYGNRNFYNFYTSWFGNTQGIPVIGKILDYWTANGGVSGFLGAPTGAAVQVAANGGGIIQEFAGGTVFVENRGGNVTGMGNGAFLSNYRAAGFVQGSWGWPVDKAACDASGCTMKFQQGTVGYSPAYGSNLIPTQLEGFWLQGGGAGGAYGYPRSKAEVSSRGDAIVQHFANGHLVWSAAGGARIFSASYVPTWQQLGGIASGVGVPKSDPRPVAQNGGGEVYEFTNGTLYLSSAGSFAMEYGQFRTGYMNAGGPEGSWGWPTAKAECGLVGGGCYMGFQNGIGMWSADTGMVLVSRPSFEMWNTVKGSIGYPTKTPSTVTANGGGEVQEFTRGTVWTSPAGSFAMEYGQFRTGYMNAGGPEGSLGWPTGKAECTVGGCTMSFQHGSGDLYNGKFIVR